MLCGNDTAFHLSSKHVGPLRVYTNILSDSCGVSADTARFPPHPSVEQSPPASGHEEQSSTDGVGVWGVPQVLPGPCVLCGTSREQQDAPGPAAPTARQREFSVELESLSQQAPFPGNSGRKFQVL